jgi:hypothetical protein
VASRGDETNRDRILSRETRFTEKRLAIKAGAEGAAKNF